MWKMTIIHKGKNGHVTAAAFHLFINFFVFTFSLKRDTSTRGEWTQINKTGVFLFLGDEIDLRDLKIKLHEQKKKIYLINNTFNTPK